MPAIKIFDTTLRDGQQCPGAGMSLEKNVEYARLAAQVGVDVLEAGFPAASQADFMIVNTIAAELAAEAKSPTIAALCQLRDSQFERTIEALQPAVRHNKARLHTYLPVAPELIQASLGKHAKHPAHIIAEVYRLIKTAQLAGFEVEFSPEGYSRMGENFDFVTDIIRAAISAGATIINCPDTIGGACKLEGENYFVEKMQQHAILMHDEFPDKAITWSVHCHNDFGLALENTLNAVLFGPATQIEGCFNGIGEHAGNVALEQCIMFIKHFGTQSGKVLCTQAHTEMLQIISNFVSTHMLPRQPHWPITGGNAAKHSSGGHTNAILKNPLAYQPFDPQETGNEISLLFGPLSGSNHAKTIIEKYGYRCSDEEKTQVAQYIKDYFAHRRKGITDQEVIQAYLHYRRSRKLSRSTHSKTRSGKNIIEKIWDAHVVHQTADHPAVFAIDFTLLHEVTSAQAFQTLQAKGLKVHDPQRFLATIDHSVPTRKNRHEIFDQAAKKQVELLRNNAKEHGIKFFDFASQHQGIVHVIGPELGVTQPGMTIVCGDSHTSTHGAFGALAFGIGTTELTHVLATGCLLLTQPKVMRVHFTGKLESGVYAKDIIMYLIATIGVGGASGYVIEYAGQAISAMSMEERMTLCNMSIECGARAGLIAPDTTTYNYLKGRQFAPVGKAWEKAIAYWETLVSDPDCNYDQMITIDIDNLQPMVTWGTNPAQAISIDKTIPQITELPSAQQATAQQALDYVQLVAGSPIKDTPIDWAFIGSCTNGRIEDLRVAAKILAGRKIHPSIVFYIVPGSEAVLAQAQAEGLDKVFQEAGADFRMPGCSLCLGMNDDKVPSGKRCISSTNRNFVGRQGTGSITHLASPATVAASAIAGKIISAKDYL